MGARVSALAASRARARAVRVLARGARGRRAAGGGAAARGPARARAIAQRLQGELSAAEIAALIGVHARTVRSYWQAGVCARCGGPQIVPEASSCADCIPYLAQRRPSRAAVVRALRRWARETGTPPRRSDWREPGGKWEREYPAWPSAGDVDAHFASWPQALAAAGLRPHRRTWTREAIIAALQTWAAAHGRAPTPRRVAHRHLEHPSTGTVKHVFGNWSAGLRAAGLEPALHARWTEDEVLDGLRAFERDHGRPPTTRDLRDTRGTPYPPASAVLRTLGSLRAALERARPPHRRAATGRPTTRSWRRCAHTRSNTAARHRRDLADRASPAQRVGDHPPPRQLEGRGRRGARPRRVARARRLARARVYGWS